MNVIAVAFRYLIGILFLLSGIAKIISLHSFVDVIQTYISFPTIVIYAIALLICIAEAGLGAAILFWQKRIVSASFGIMLMTLIFSGVQVWIIMNGTASECFCFGILTDDMIGWQTLARNGVIMFGSWILVQTKLK